MNPDSTQPRSEICLFSWMNKSYTARLKFRFGSFNWSWSWSWFRFSWLIEIASLSPILAFLDLHQHSFVFSTTEFLEPSPKKSNHCSCLWTCFYWPELKKKTTNTTSRTVHHPGPTKNIQHRGRIQTLAGLPGKFTSLRASNLTLRADHPAQVQRRKHQGKMVVVFGDG